MSELGTVAGLVTSLLQHLFYPGLFAILVVCGLGIPIPEDLTIITSGYLVAMGYGKMWAVIPLAIAGVLGGDTVLYWMSRHYGQRLMRLPMFSHIFTEHRIERARHLFHRYGGRVLLVARFTAGIRGSSHVVAGLLELPYRTFLFYDAAAAVVSVPIMVGLGWYFADDINRLFRWEHQTTWAILGVVVLLIAALFILHWRTRRREEINAKGEEEEDKRG